MRGRVNGIYLFKFKHLAIEKLYWSCAGEMATAQKSLQNSNCCSDDNVIRYCTHTYISSFVSIVFKVLRKLMDGGYRGIHGTVGASSVAGTQSIKYPRGRVAIELESAAIKGKRRQSSRCRRLDRVNFLSIISNPAVQDIENIICIRIIDIYKHLDSRLETTDVINVDVNNCSNRQFLNLF